MYIMHVRTKAGTQSSSGVVTFKKPIEQWFDTTGKLEARLFAQDWKTWLASLAPAKKTH